MIVVAHLPVMCFVVFTVRRVVRKDNHRYVCITMVMNIFVTVMPCGRLQKNFLVLGVMAVVVHLPLRCLVAPHVHLSSVMIVVARQEVRCLVVFGCAERLHRSSFVTYYIVL